MRSHELVCLVPARNCAGDLPAYFDSVSRFADAVVALDDGSTDATREVLERERLVRVLLSNPRRETYQGWDDAQNRSRLLDAAGALRARWILFLDADERIPPDDGAALRRFLERDALPGVAYGLRVYRMIDGLESYDRASLWVYRLFAYREGQALPDTKLHLVPIPTEIPRERWIKTTIRIQHLSSLDESRRAARYRKYREADPGNRYQNSYRHLLDPQKYHKPWVRRPEGEPVVKEIARHRRIAVQQASRSASAKDSPGSTPTLSAIVIAQDDRARIESVMEALVRQEVSEPFEIILVDSGSDGTAEFVRQRYPQVRVVHLPEPALPGRARNAGLEIARGRYVSFPGSHVVIEPGALQHRIEAHGSGAGMVTGSTLNGTPTLSGWASYFLDHSEALPGRPSSELDGPPSHCSYRTDALVSLGGFPEDRRVGEDTVVNRELFRRGYRALRSSKIRFFHRSPCRTPVRLARHHFQRGRGFGRILWERAGARQGLRERLRDLAWILSVYPLRRFRLVTANVVRWGRPLRRHYVASLPLVGIGIASAALGAFTFLLRPSGARVSPLERARRRARSDSGRLPDPLGAFVPTLFYVVPSASRDAMRAYVERWGPTPGSRMEFVFHEDLVGARELPSGSYLFAGTERLPPAQVALLRGLSHDLSKAPDRARVLNDPRRLRSHWELLARLREVGINRFGVARASELPSSLRFPVFLRRQFGARALLSPLLRNEAELHRAVQAARRRGYSPSELVVTEFSGGADADGAFRHYSAFRVGDEILPRNLSWSRDWQGRKPLVPDASREREREEFLEENPHEDLLRAICEMAGVDFGRIDYGVLDGGIQVWDVCTNPTVRKLTARLSLGFEALDSIPDSLEPIPIRIEPSLIGAWERERRRRMRWGAVRRAVEGLAGGRLRGPLQAR